MSANKTPQEKYEEELKQEDYDHHNNPTAAAMTNHVLANIHTMHVKLHQYHWYVKGPNFFALHAKFEDLYDENEKWFDKLAEVLLSSGEKPVSTTEKFLKYSLLKENGADKYLGAERMVENVVADYRATRDLVTRTINMAGEVGQFVLEDTLIGYKEAIDKNIWMLQAFLGKEALEDDPEFEDDEDDE